MLVGILWEHRPSPSASRIALVGGWGREGGGERGLRRAWEGGGSGWEGVKGRQRCCVPGGKVTSGEMGSELGSERIGEGWADGWKLELPLRRDHAARGLGWFVLSA
eukprot:1194520-Prorocentrum_minimum.AAC.2